MAVRPSKKYREIMTKVQNGKALGAEDKAVLEYLRKNPILKKEGGC